MQTALPLTLTASWLDLTHTGARTKAEVFIGLEEEGRQGAP